MKRRLNGSRRGLILIEVLFAIFLVMTAALIVAATLPVSNESRQKTWLSDKAMDVCQKQVEAIRTLGFQNANVASLAQNGLIDSTTPVSGTTYSFTNSDSTVLDNPGLLLPNGVGTVDIEQLNLNMVQITVNVTWTDNGNPMSYTLGTLEANL